MDIILLFIIWMVFKVAFKHIGNIQKQQQNQSFPSVQGAKKPGQPGTVNDWLTLFTGKPQVNRTKKYTGARYAHLASTTLAAKAGTGSMDLDPMISEPMNGEDMTAENMEAEPMVAEQLVDPDQVEDISSGIIPEPELMHVNSTYNSWAGKVTRKEIRRGFIMAQVLGKPRALEPYKGQ